MNNFNLLDARKVFPIFSTMMFMSVMFVSQSHAGNVAGVFSPIVNKGGKTFQYRSGYDIDSHQLVQRLHYQESVSDNVWLRAVVQGRETDQSDLDYDFFQGELLWQLDDNSSVWSRALRFDVRITDDGRPGLFSTSWTNQLKWSENWKSTALIMGSVDIGSGSRSGVFLQTRADLVRTINNRWSVGAEMFSSYGSTTDFGSFDDQSHQVGPTLKGKLGNGWSFFSGVLFGISDASQDENLRLWFTKSL